MTGYVTKVTSEITVSTGFLSAAVGFVALPLLTVPPSFGHRRSGGARP
jgi:hypothetical protein